MSFAFNAVKNYVWSSSSLAQAEHTVPLQRFDLHNAWDIMQNETARRRIVTSCKELDEILGGGIAPKEVTEISGVPGVGKTQLGMQLSVNVQIPPEYGGAGGHAVYIDTEGSFMVERAVQMAESCIQEIKSRASAHPQTGVEPMRSQLDVKTFLSHIYYFRIHSPEEQIAVVNMMESFLSQHKRVRLIVMDSVAYQFRQGLHNMGERTRILCTMGQKLAGLAIKHELAIVIINQITQKITEEGVKVFVPALGETWGHSTTNRLSLYWSNQRRYAFLFKSSNLPRKGAPFTISGGGIQSVVDECLSYM